MDTPGERIAWALARKGKSENWLAGQIDVHRPTIVRWINGERLPSWENIGPLAEALDVSIAWLYSGHGEPTDVGDAPAVDGTSQRRASPKTNAPSDSTERRQRARGRRQEDRE